MISEEELNVRWVKALIETREMNAAARLMFRQLEAEKDKRIAELEAVADDLQRRLNALRGIMQDN